MTCTNKSRSSIEEAELGLFVKLALGWLDVRSTPKHIGNGGATGYQSFSSRLLTMGKFNANTQDLSP